MKYDIAIQFMDPSKTRPDSEHDANYVIEGDGIAPIPCVGDLMTYERGSKRVTAKVILRAFHYFLSSETDSSSYRVQIFVSDPSANETEIMTRLIHFVSPSE